ncbi:hypothetical protein GUJ93_ZPchr0006g43548 [Zizania palustris]|uniref:Uncharacterized protein n=1 Tax=Zizania palustris TaxID=103762 RepID=A0A8J5W1R8_ZIZPA|nr:hypothetical protein GUJ93_ZPchr0006g43548 [Zizania palustris]
MELSSLSSLHVFVNLAEMDVRQEQPVPTYMMPPPPAQLAKTQVYNHCIRYKAVLVMMDGLGYPTEPARLLTGSLPRTSEQGSNKVQLLPTCSCHQNVSA